MDKEAKIINFKEKQYSNEYIGVFKDYIQVECEGDCSIDNMIFAIGLINEKLLPLLDDELSVEKVDEIIEATHYVAEKVFTSKENEEKIIKNWNGDYPLLFNLGSFLEYEKYKTIADTTLEDFSEDKKDLFEKIMDVVWNTRENRKIIVGDKTVFFSRMIEEELIDGLHCLAKYFVIDFMKSNEGVNLLMFVKESVDGDVISALVNTNGIISVVDAELLKWSYTHDAVTGKLVNTSGNEKYENFNIKL